MNRIALLLTLFSFQGFPVFSQNVSEQEQSEENIFAQAEFYLSAENFTQALPLYQQLLSADTANANLLFKVGLCYLNITFEKENAIDYFKKALRNISEEANPDSFDEIYAPVEAHYFLGQAYHKNYKFEEAIQILSILKLKYAKNDENFTKIIDKLMKECEVAMELVQSPIDIKIENLGAGINTQFSEHSPVFSADESVLIFTSKRDGGTGDKKTDDGQYFEDIYVSNKVNGKWSEPKGIGKSINSEGHEATIGLSIDGRQLFVYKDDKGDGNIYTAFLEGENWSELGLLGSNINSNAQETHATLAADGRTIYFTSDRKGGLGGRDIYIVRMLPNGEWGKAQNLGPEINTEYDEEGPYLHPDGVTLYFSSSGHKTMGGYDIFVSEKKEDGTWSTPENLGYPLNTTEDDVFYVPTVDAKRAYYSSNMVGGLGNNDLYLIKVPTAPGKALTVFTGVVKMKDGTAPKEGLITVVDTDTDEDFGVYTPNSHTGKYLLVLPTGEKFAVKYQAENDNRLVRKLEVEPGTSYEKMERAIELDPVIFDSGLIENVLVFKEDSTETNPAVDKVFKEVPAKTNENNETLNLNNVLFGFDQYSTNEYNKELMKLTNYMKNYPTAVIEVIGHTDSQGEEEYNQMLSLRRAGFVKDFLIKNGATAENIKTKGMGESQPIAIDLNPKSRKYNRRTEIKIIKHGSVPLQVVPVDVPMNYRFN